MSGIQPGQYSLYVAKAGFAQASTSDPISVGQIPVADLEVRLATGVTLSGEILGLGLDELAGLKITAANGREIRRGMLTSRAVTRC